jgi:hypothetical protein
MRRRELMPSSERQARIQGVLLLAILLVLGRSATCLSQSLAGTPKREERVDRESSATENRESLANYKGKNGILSLKTVVLGGDFRVTTVIPFKGNLAEYHHLEITRPVSLVGAALTPQISSQQLDRLKSQLEERKLFETVKAVETYNPPPATRSKTQLRMTSKSNGREEQDVLDAPMGSFADIETRDKQRLGQEHEEQASDLTLVAVIEVLDYAKGSRLKQLLPLDLGKSILTVRLRYYDKNSGKEIGRQIVSGRASGSSLLGPLSPRDALSGVADGFVDQVSRRVAASVK